MNTSNVKSNNAPAMPADSRPVPSAPVAEIAGRFAKQLDRAEQKLSNTNKQRDTPAAPKANPLLRSPANLARRSEDEKRNDTGLPSAMVSELRGPAPAQVQGAAVQPLFDPATIEAMAARIAESCAATREPVFSVAFAPGAVASGVILTRGVNDTLIIRILGFDPRLSALEERRLCSGLSEALNRRRLRVGSVTGERSAADD